MKIFEIKLEASVHIMPFDSTNIFRYEELDTIQSTNNRINFNALVEIKQSREAKDKYIEIELVRIHDMGEEDETSTYGRSNQTLSHLHLDSVQLFDLDNSKHAKTLSNPNFKIINDPWEIKQHIKFSFEEVPMNGPGTYAVALSIRSPKDANKRLLIDCDYFEVM